MHPNLIRLLNAAKALGPLKEQVVFVGGATTTLYLDQSKLSDIDARQTGDVDYIVEVTNLRKYQKLEEELRNLGFTPVEDMICRFQKGDIIIDMMPIDENILGFSNRWYKEGIINSYAVTVKDEEIRILTFPYFLTTKLEAFKGRGNGDYYGSKDMEDIITVLEGRPQWLFELKNTPPNLFSYIKTEFVFHLKNEAFVQCITGHLSKNGNLRSKANKILAELKDLISL